MNTQIRRRVLYLMIHASVPLAAALLVAGCHSGGGAVPPAAPQAAVPVNPQLQQFEAQRNAAMEYDAKRRAAALAAAPPAAPH